MSDTVATRAPCPTDDASAGYVVGALWYTPAGLFRCVRNTVGAAAWQDVRSLATALPLDTVAGAIAAFGMRKLRAAYTGFCIDVVRNSDGACLAVGFVGPALDTASLDPFLVDATGAVTRWYDQSGNGNDAIAEIATAPHLCPASMIGNSRSLLLDSQCDGHSFAPASFLTVPREVTAAFNASSIVSLAAARNYYHGPTHVAEWSGGSTAVTIGRCMYGYNLGASTPDGGTYPIPGAFPSLTPFVHGYTSKADDLQVWRDDLTFSTGAGSGVSETLAGGLIGAARSCDDNTGYFELGAVIFYARGMSETERERVTASLHFQFGTVPQARSIVVAAGDSITEGYGSTLLRSYPRIGSVLLRKPMQIFNSAQLGATASLIASNYRQIIGPLFAACAPDKIVTLCAGTNDIATDFTAAQIEANLVAFASQARATGSKVVVSTILPRLALTSDQEAVRQVVNRSIGRSWRAFADGIMDFDADPTMGGAQATAANSALYGDGTHPTPLGYDFLANVWAAAINSVVRP